MTPTVTENLYICGPMAAPSQPAAGGYEASNLRLSALQNELAANAAVLPYPSVKSRHRITKLFAYAMAFLGIYRVCKTPEANSAIHFTPLFSGFLRFEIFLFRAAKRANRTIVMDLRAGTKVSAYENGSTSYRKKFLEALSLADEIAVEGEKFIPFLQEIRPDLTIRHLPNFILDSEIHQAAPEKDSRAIRCVYVGSVNEQKGVRQSVQLVRMLRDQGVEIVFDVFGRVSPEFQQELQAIAGPEGGVTFHGPRPYSDIQDALAKAHFFLFLSKWYGEGHSNALTEAMSQGCIPVVTDHGFSKSVIGDTGLCVEDRDDTEAIAGQLNALLHDPQARDRCSRAAWERVKTHYSETAVKQILLSIYNRP